MKALHVSGLVLISVATLICDAQYQHHERCDVGGPYYDQYESQYGKSPKTVSFVAKVRVSNITDNGRTAKVELLSLIHGIRPPLQFTATLSKLDYARICRRGLVTTEIAFVGIDKATGFTVGIGVPLEEEERIKREIRSNAADTTVVVRRPDASECRGAPMGNNWFLVSGDCVKPYNASALRVRITGSEDESNVTQVERRSTKKRHFALVKATLNVYVSPKRIARDFRSLNSCETIYPRSVNSSGSCLDGAEQGEGEQLNGSCRKRCSRSAVCCSRDDGENSALSQKDWPLLFCNSLLHGFGKVTKRSTCMRFMKIANGDRRWIEKIVGK